jgi:hypothetical protein
MHEHKSLTILLTESREVDIEIIHSGEAHSKGDRDEGHLDLPRYRLGIQEVLYRQSERDACQLGQLCEHELIYP